MTSDKTASPLPQWPLKLSREEQREAKNRRSIFDSTLKVAAKNIGWQVARGSVFKKQGEWFADYLASLTYQRGAVVQILIKPMALDPLFWKIVGLEENNRQPLSFRANGAWVLRPPARQEYVGKEESNPSTLAEITAVWAENWLTTNLPEISISKMLQALMSREQLSGQNRSLAICLNVLEGDFGAAERLIPPPATSGNNMLSDAGGFSTRSPSGQFLTFYDQAATWIQENRLRLH
jgi:hypothetical protein